MSYDTQSKVYLASASPRRRELLAQIGVPVTQISCAIDESVRPGEVPLDYVQRVTRDKVLAGVAAAPAGMVVIAADTAVVIADQILGKPVDRADGMAMLRSLSGNTHQVITAVAVARDTDVRVQPVITQVRFRTLSDLEMADYWATGEPIDKAGGYAIQGLGAVFVAHIEGNYSAVVGLPLMETAQLLKQFSIPCWQTD